MTQLSCSASNNSATWGSIDVFVWKVIPKRFGGGKQYIQNYKDSWVKHNKSHIEKSAKKYNLPVDLLVGVCWIEVGGDPKFIDSLAYNVRAFDWSGPDWVDSNMTLTNRPEKTSFGFVSIQLRTAADTLEISPKDRTSKFYRQLATCLERDIYNIDIVAKHLLKLVKHDGYERSLPNLTDEQIRIVGARYNRGTGLSLARIRQNTSYGDFILKFRPRFEKLMK